MTTPSCRSCVFRLSNLDAPMGAEYAGTSAPQVDVCTRFDQILGGPPGTPAEIAEDEAEEIASRCSAYGDAEDELEQAAARTFFNQAEVAPGAVGSIGAPLHLTLPLEVPVDRGDGTAPVNCGRCAYFCWPDEFADNSLPTVSKQGRGAGLCVAKGTIQDAGPGARKVVASKCSTFTPIKGPQSDAAAEYRTELLGMAEYKPHLVPLLADSAVGERKEEVAEAAKAVAEEREPTDAERADGIAGFRRFFSDDNTRWVDLPIFDPEHFDEVERAKIPVDGSEGAPEVYVDHANLGYREIGRAHV